MRIVIITGMSGSGKRTGMKMLEDMGFYCIDNMPAGLSGFGVGGAQVSPKHCGFIINKGNATASDITTLIGHIKRTVYKASGIMLETELIVLGQPKRFR